MSSTVAIKEVARLMDVSMVDDTQYLGDGTIISNKDAVHRKGIWDGHTKSV